MLFRSLLAAASSSLALFAYAQTDDAGQSELPAITGSPDSEGDCGGCYVVADVADVVFGNEHITQVDTEVVSVITGRNGTNSTVTAVIAATTLTTDVGQFSFGPNGLLTGTNAVGGGVSYGNETTIVVGGVTLTSPTQYQVFTAYSLTSTTRSGGKCIAVPGKPIPVSPAYQVAVPKNAGPDFILEAENSFINFIQRPTCSAAGANVNSQTQSIVTTITSSSTTVGPTRITPQALSTAAVASSTSSSSSSSPTSSSTSTTIISSTATVVIVSNATSPAPTGTGAPVTPTISMMPFPGTGASLSASSWLLWVAGFVGLVVWA